MVIELQTCRGCGRVNYPDREVCGDCLEGELEYRAQDDSGRLLSWTRLHASLEPMFQDRLPWLIGTVKLDCGPVVIAHLAAASVAQGQVVRVTRREDPAGRSVLVAYPADGDAPESGALFGSEDS